MASPWTEHRLQKLFERYNKRYWEGRIPPYRVKLDSTRKTCYCDSGSRQILLGVSAVGSYHVVRKSLLHEMAHAMAGSGHGANWQVEIRRLVNCGVPGMSKELSWFARLSATIGRQEIINQVEDAANETDMRWRVLKDNLISQYKMKGPDGTFLKANMPAFLDQCKKAYQRARRRARGHDHDH